MNLIQLRARLEAYLSTLSALSPETLASSPMTLSTLGEMLGAEFWLLLMYQQPGDPQTMSRIATALEHIEKRMPPAY